MNKTEKKYIRARINQIIDTENWNENPELVAKAEKYGELLWGKKGKAYPNSGAPSKKVKVTDLDGIITIYPSLKVCAKKLNLTENQLQKRLAGKCQFDKRKFERVEG